MTIPDNAMWGVIGSLLSLLLLMVGLLHKDMKRSIEKMADLLTPLIRQVDKHDLKLDEHSRQHSEHREAITELKKSLQLHDTRITKIEDRI